MINKIFFKIHTKIFLILYIIFFISGTFIILNYSKSTIHIFINQFHNDFFDNFFKILTNLGDGVFVIIIAILLLFYKIRYSIGLITTFITSGILAQIIKHIADTPRPTLYFKDIYDLYLVEGVKIMSHHSFPSGHSATAFAFCFCLAFFAKKKIIQFFLFILAILIAFSRVYLSQHFFIDILFGSLIGVITGYVYSIYDKKLQYKWLDISIVSLIK